MKRILCLLPNKDFDPTETGVPWKIFTEAGHSIVFATPNGRQAKADPIMVTGTGLGFFKYLLMADANGLSAYNQMILSDFFKKPLSYSEVQWDNFDALLLPGGHAKGMCEYLESKKAQSIVAHFFDHNKPVGAICHGTLMAARSISKITGKSVLYGKVTTGLTFIQEMIAWNLTRVWMGDYYRTYETPMEFELCTNLQSTSDYTRGPFPFVRDSPENLKPGFTILDGNYLSARWPGDVHKFANDFRHLLESF